MAEAAVTGGKDRLVGHLSDEFCLALGRVTASFGSLEEQLKRLAIGLINCKDQELGQIITAELPFRGLVALVSSLFAHRYGDEACHELDAILTRATGVEARRNGVTHSDWWPGHAAGERFRFKTTAKKRTGLSHRVERVRPADIEAIAADASIVAAAVAKLSVKVWTEGLAEDK